MAPGIHDLTRTELALRLESAGKDNIWIQAQGQGARVTGKCIPWQQSGFRQYAGQVCVSMVAAQLLRQAPVRRLGELLCAIQTDTLSQIAHAAHCIGNERAPLGESTA